MMGVPASLETFGGFLYIVALIIVVCIVCIVYWLWERK